MAPPRSSTKTPPQQKEKIPYEIKNAREWDPTKAGLYGDSTDESEYEEDDDYEWDYTKGPYVSGGPQADDLKASDPPQSQQNGFRPSSHSHHNQKIFTHGKRPAGARKHPKRVFNYKEDNLAIAAYRKRLPHTGKFILHKDCHEIEPNRAKLYDMLQEMGVRFGSFIRPPQEVKDRELLIWGNATQVERTIAEIQKWLSPTRVESMGRKSTAKDKFASEYSNIGSKYKTLQKQMARDTAIQKFQQVPETGKVFPYIGSFIWPVDELRPEDILGSSYEAFDPIRFQHQCHIIFDNKDSCFKIMAAKAEPVMETMIRIEGTMKEYVAKSRRRTIANLVEPPNVSAIGKDVKMESGPSFGSATTASLIPSLTGRALNPDECGTLAKRTVDMTTQNHCRIEQALHKCIPDLLFYRGQVHIRVNFGTFALTVVRRSGAEPLPFEDFVKNMAMTGTRGDLVRDLYIEKDASAIMDYFHKADGIFQPLDNSIYTLEEVAPSFSARFEFQKGEEINQPAIQLDVELNTSGLDNLYEKTHALWTRIDRRDNAVPLSVFMVRLDSGVSWKLQASTENTIDQTRIHPRMTAFADNVKLKKLPKNKIALTGEKIFQWEKDMPGTMLPISFQQKTSFEYRLVHDVDWVFEISRYDTYGNPKDEKMPTQTCWAATMWNTEWNSTLATNSALEIGQVANWNPSLTTFFPSTSGKAKATQGVDPGVMGFLKSVQIITTFLDGIKKGSQNKGS